MSTPASWPELAGLLEHLDPRVREEVLDDAIRRQGGAQLSLKGHVVLVGHRAAGKSRLLRPLAKLIGLPAVDLDEELAARAGMPVRALFERSELGFRSAERAAFLGLTGQVLVAAGGGFLSAHADLLDGHTPVLVPVSEETYRERLLRDASRPRLRPDLSLEDELKQVFAEREALHRSARTVPLAALLAGFSGAKR